MSENSSGGSSKNGFGGFGDMVTDVDKHIESVSRELSNAPKPSTKTTEHSNVASQPTNTEDVHVYPPISAPMTSGSNRAKWFWWVAIVIVALIIIGNSGKEKNSSYASSPTYSSPPTYSTTTSEATTQPVAIDPPALPREEKPPIGTNISLSRDQIRYCLSEDIRLGGMKSVVNQYVDSDVNTFNGMVGDYNSRCSSYRYRKGALESVRSEVETNRSTLEADGAARLSVTPEATGLKDSSDFTPLSTPTNRQKLPESSNRIEKSSKQQENYTSCLDGNYPSLCNHSWLVGNEVAEVRAAEHRANYKSCIDGNYPSLCHHSWLVGNEVAEVREAEHRANYKSCIDGNYPSLCNHSWLVGNEVTEVRTAERRANYISCIDGNYPSLCNHSWLVGNEVAEVRAAERRAN